MARSPHFAALAFALVFALVGASSSGCLSRRAKRASDAGDHQRAVELYERAVARFPRHAKLRERLRDARRRQVDAELETVATLRRSGRGALATGRLEALLVQADSWELEPGQDKTIEHEIEAAANRDHAETRAVLEAYGPLTAERTLPPVEALMHRDAYRRVREETVATLQDEGAMRCRTLGEQSREQPHLAWLVAFYCRHFDAPLAPSLPRPDACQALSFEGSIRGASPDETSRLQTAVEEAFRVSPLHDRRAPCRIHIVLSGSREDEHSVERVHQTAQWTEQVPYTATETVRVPHQVPYSATEYYTVQEPQTTTETYSYSCGFDPPRMCTGTRPKTTYRSVTKSRTVTKYRTEYRTETRSVTRYRAVPRVFEYDADRHTYVYRAEGSLFVQGPVDVHVPVTWNFERDASGLEHQASFSPAGVSPQSPALPSRGSLFAEELQVARARVLTSMAQSFEARHCAHGPFDANRAAACLLARPAGYPRNAAETLERAFGERVDALADLVPRNPFGGDL